MIGEPVRFSRERRTALIARAAVFAAALIAASVSLAVALGFVGRLWPAGSWTVRLLVLVVIGFAGLRETRLTKLPLFQRRWQVPRQWLSHFWFGAGAFGAIMGVGVLTFTPSAWFYVYLVGCTLTGHLWLAATCGAVYGACFSAAALGEGP